MKGTRILAGLCAVTMWLSVAPGWAFAASAEEGKKTFEARKCINCHTLGSQKGPMASVGGSLDGVGAKRDAAWLTGYLKDPKSQIPTAKMPKYTYTDQDLNALVQYMLTIK